MTGGVKLEFPAMTINEAVMTATTRWRTLVEDPKAMLPWSTNIEFYEKVEPTVEDGVLVEGAPVMMASVRIEFDRKLIEEITGVDSAA